MTSPSTVDAYLVVSNTGLNGSRSFEQGTTLGQALNGLKLGDPSSLQVKVNRQNVGLDHVIAPGDKITVVPRNMKAA